MKAVFSCRSYRELINNNIANNMLKNNLLPTRSKNKNRVVTGRGKVGLKKIIINMCLFLHISFHLAGSER